MSNSNASCFRVVLSWVELRWVLTIFEMLGWGTQHIKLMDIWPDVLNGVGTPHIILRKSLAVGWDWVGGRRVRGPSQIIMPVCGSILQDGTCKILSSAENPR